jgi:hypothetical protein
MIPICDPPAPVARRPQPHVSRWLPVACPRRGRFGPLRPGRSAAGMRRFRPFAAPSIGLLESLLTWRSSPGLRVICRDADDRIPRFHATEPQRSAASKVVLRSAAPFDRLIASYRAHPRQPLTGTMSVVRKTRSSLTGTRRTDILQAVELRQADWPSPNARRTTGVSRDP